ncbi:hypothetical protein JK361_24145 [Streptomyces sp. 5-8]|uniref:Uncharacterized protein n=1 Tax=Streptomyces musisoli TaxID=2802280 RepID=A0ABS1P5W7_9ACTN|nr:hypothetical protein [Streptomyces musisoli]MBL1107654.1 hypothetical protein [Streptomyces musisoli]
MRRRSRPADEPGPDAGPDRERPERERPERERDEHERPEHERDDRERSERERSEHERDGPLLAQRAAIVFLPAAPAGLGAAVLAELSGSVWPVAVSVGGGTAATAVLFLKEIIDQAPAAGAGVTAAVRAAAGRRGGRRPAGE